MKQNKCRGCGLVNFGDATACQRCGLGLGAHSHNPRAAQRGGAPGALARLRGRLFIAAVAVSALCGGSYVYRHPAATALRESITSKVTGGRPTPRADSGQPHLGDDAKKPSRTLTVEEFERVLDGGGGEQDAGQPDESNRSDINRRYEEEHDRALRAGMQQERHTGDQARDNQAYQQRTPAAASPRR